MKQIINKKTIFLSLVILLIIAGSIILCVTGFNKSIEYKAGKRIEIYIPQGYEKQDIIKIVEDSFNKKDFLFEEVEKLNQIASIKLEEYAEEELENFKKQIAKKYEIAEEKLELYEIEVPETKINTLVEPYVLPVVLTTLVSLIYMLFRNLKSEQKWKNILKILLTVIFAVLTYFSLILIFRLQFGVFTMPVALAIYMISLIISVNKNNK